MDYKFESELVEGIIKSRPNRFIMMVKIKGKIVKCHCPATGRIGEIVFENVPCLLSKGTGAKRKTAYTVEAVSFDAPWKKSKRWIGINQNEANKYIEFFLRNGRLGNIASGEVRRERKLGNSRIDFAVGDAFVEIKTPLMMLPTPKSIRHVKHARFNSLERLIRHYTDLAKSLRHGSKAAVIFCFLYNARRFVPPPVDRYNRKIHAAVKSATRKGVENWQVNLSVSRRGVKLLKYFRLNLF
jgi:sugar fermentation stimulation protein A